MRHDIIKSSQPDHMVESIRRLLELESVHRKVIFVDALPEEV